MTIAWRWSFLETLSRDPTRCCPRIMMEARWFSLHAMDSTSLLDMLRLVFAHSRVWTKAGPSDGIPGPLAHLSHHCARAQHPCPRHNLFSALRHCSLHRLYLRNLRYIRIWLVLWEALNLTRCKGFFYSCKHLS
jgi:hypothetical protein